MQAGPLEGVYIPKDKAGNQRTFGFVEFTHEISVGYASALLNGISLYGRAITVKPSEGSGSESPGRSSPGLTAEASLSPQALMNTTPERGFHRSLSVPETLPRRQWLSCGSPQFFNSPNPQARNQNFLQQATLNRMQMGQFPVNQLPPMQHWNSSPAHQNGQNYKRRRFPR